MTSTRILSLVLAICIALLSSSVAADEQRNLRKRLRRRQGMTSRIKVSKTESPIVAPRNATFSPTVLASGEERGLITDSPTEVASEESPRTAPAPAPIVQELSRNKRRRKRDQTLRNNNQMSKMGRNKSPAERAREKRRDNMKSMNKKGRSRNKNKNIGSSIQRNQHKMKTMGKKKDRTPKIVTGTPGFQEFVDVIEERETPDTEAPSASPTDAPSSSPTAEPTPSPTTSEPSASPSTVPTWSATTWWPTTEFETWPPTVTFPPTSVWDDDE